MPEQFGTSAEVYIVIVNKQCSSDNIKRKEN